jgi:hypothetical protein
MRCAILRFWSVERPWSMVTWTNGIEFSVPSSQFSEKLRLQTTLI